jgi:hypothetical protein
MLIGHGVNQLEQRITEALCSGSLHLKESEFLQQISRKIGLYRERAVLTDSQASWLFTILTSFERGTTSRSSKTRTPASSRMRSPARSSLRDTSETPQLTKALAGLDGVIWAEEEMPEAFDITQALEPNGGI